eukprot:gene10248-11950_t
MAIYITRHGLREDWINREWKKTAPRPSDPPLSAEGFIVAEELGKCIDEKHREIKHIFCSPMERCVQTATEIAKRLGIPIKIEYGAIEWLGHYPDEKLLPLPIEELAKSYNIDTTYVPSTTLVPNGESEDVLRQRAKACMDYLKEKYAGESYIVVTHAATLIALACAAIDGDYPFRSGVCSLTRLVKASTGDWTVDFSGDVSHLSKGEQYHWTFPTKKSPQPQH